MTTPELPGKIARTWVCAPQRGLQVLPLPHAAHFWPCCSPLTHKHKPKRPELVPVGKRRPTDSPPRLRLRSGGAAECALPVGLPRLLERAGTGMQTVTCSGMQLSYMTTASPSTSEPPLLI